MKVSEAIEKRWSPRAFSKQLIARETILELLQAAATAPSCFNEQPWRYLVGFKGDETYQKIFNCMGEYNQSWTKTAPILMVGCVKKTFDLNGKQNVHARHDLGAATAYLTMKAIDQDIFVHQMAGFSTEAVKSEFELSDNFEAVTAIALGHLGDKKDLPEDLAKQESPESPRHPVSEFAFNGSWGNPV